MLKKIKKTIDNSTPTRYNRIKNYISILEENIIIENKKDKSNVNDMKKITMKLIDKVQVYYTINTVLYIALYFSFISYFFTDIVILSKIAEIISKIISLLGTTIFVIAIYFSHKIIDLYYQDLNLLTSHLIAIYSKYQKKDMSEIIENNKNIYEVFIDYYNKRYK